MASNHIIINGLGGNAKGTTGLTKNFLGSAIATIVKWQERASMRHHLATLDKNYLDDMGVSTHQALEEIAKPFWRA